jgi:hypothetical protein
MKKSLLYITIICLLLTAASCTKDDVDVIPDYLYGSWKITNGDTVTFSQINGKYIATANLAYLPTRKREDYEFTYRHEKLGIKNYPPFFRQDYVFFDSFEWIQPGQSFKIRKMQWFILSSDTDSYYTFTKIP